MELIKASHILYKTIHNVKILNKGVVFKLGFLPKGACCRTQELGDPKQGPLGSDFVKIYQSIAKYYQKRPKMSRIQKRHHFPKKKKKKKEPAATPHIHGEDLGLYLYIYIYIYKHIFVYMHVRIY